jgi:secreted trypsin-like serine protease
MGGSRSALRPSVSPAPHLAWVLLRFTKPRERHNVKLRLAAAAVAAAAVAAAALVIPGVASATDTAPRPAIAPHLVGGHPATQSYPWIASMQISYGGNPDFHNCTASLIAPQWIRVNAHCVTNPDGTAIDPAQWHLHVRVGSNDRTTGGDTANVTRIIVMPGWNWGQLDSAGRVDDLALLKLDTYLPEQPLDIWTHDLPPGAKVRQLGWGRMDPSNTGPAPVQLQELDTTIDTPSACDTNADLPMAKGEFCVTNAYGTDGACGGDSGGSVVFQHDGRWEELGGTSRSAGLVPGCGGEPDVYTDTAGYFRPWEYAVMRGEDPVAAERYLPGGVAQQVIHPGPDPIPVASLVPYYNMYANTGHAPMATATHGPGPQ